MRIARLVPAVAFVAVIAVVAAACSGGEEPVTQATVSVERPGSTAEGNGGEPGRSTSSTAPPEPTQLALVGVAELGSLTAMAVHPSSDRLYVAERDGRVQAVDPTTGAAELVLDLSGEVSTDFEKGLLGLAISPGGDLMYVSYTDLAGDTRLHEVALEAGGVADPSTRREVLTQDQPFGNHNGGQVAFGPDGELYLGLGDGGGAGDPLETGQDPTDLLGSILRIDPTGGEPYAIPAGNPFVDGGGAPEVWLYGARNPWRFSWDRETGDLWVADVGQNDWEEIDLLPAPESGRGANLGWAEVEGLEAYEGGTEPDDHVPPVFVYGRDEGCSIIGGFVYRGGAIPFLRGAYVYGDFCEGRILAIRVSGMQVIEQIDLGLEVGGNTLVSFGEDASGELYVLTLAGILYRIEPA